MSEWETVRLGDIAEVIMGQSPTGDTYNRSRIGTPLLNGPTEFGNSHPIPALWTNSPTKICEKGDILFCVRGSTTGRMNWADQPYCLGRGIGAIRGKSYCGDTKFVFYTLVGELPRLLSRCSGSVFPNLSRSDIADFEVVAPPLEEQKRIAHILGTLDDKIELNRRMNATLEEIARTVFKAWFVDFEPFGGTMPEDWGVGTLKEITGILSGFAFKSSDWKNEGIPVVKIGSVKPGIVDLNQVSFVSEAVAQQAKRYELLEGDLLIGMTGYVGEVGLVPPNHVAPLLNQRVSRFVLPERGTKHLGFIYCLTRDDSFKNAVISKSHGTAQANVSADGILSVETIIPSNKIVNQFNALMKPLLDRILANIGENQTLAALREALLPKLLAGESGSTK